MSYLTSQVGQKKKISNSILSRTQIITSFTKTFIMTMAGILQKPMLSKAFLAGTCSGTAQASETAGGRYSDVQNLSATVANENRL